MFYRKFLTSCFVSGADSLCGRLTEKINSNHNHKLVLAHMPLLMVCLEGLGKLAQKFPNIASTSIYCLRDFLITPSPILFKLHRQSNERGNKENLKVTGKSSLLFSCLPLKLVHIFVSTSFVVFFGLVALKNLDLIFCVFSLFVSSFSFQFQIISSWCIFSLADGSFLCISTEI